MNELFRTFNPHEETTRAAREWNQGPSYEDYIRPQIDRRGITNANVDDRPLFQNAALGATPYNVNKGRTSAFMDTSGRPISMGNALAAQEYNINPALFGSYYGKVGLRDAVKDRRENVVNPEGTLDYLQSEIFADEMSREEGWHPSGTNLRQGIGGLEYLWNTNVLGHKGKVGVGLTQDFDDNIINFLLKYRR